MKNLNAEASIKVFEIEQPPGGYAIGKNELYWRAVHGPDLNSDFPGWVSPDYETEYYWPPEKGEPPTPKPPLPSPEDILLSARSERDRLLAYATLRIDPLQDDVDLGKATAEGVELLKSWKQYRSSVSKVEILPGWPESPQWPSPPVPLE